MEIHSFIAGIELSCWKPLILVRRLCQPLHRVHCWSAGEYGEQDVCLGVPMVIGAGGVERIIELKLSADEKTALHGSAEAVRSGIAVLKERKIL